MSGVLESSGVEQIAEVIPVVGHKVVFRVENCQLDRCAHIQSYYSSTLTATVLRFTTSAPLALAFDTEE